MMNHGDHGWDCSCWHALGALLWFAALISFILAWVAASSGKVWTMDQGQWFANALILGVLAIPLKLKKGHGMGCECSTCRPSKR